jgi:YD repeat-containing protein
MSDREKAELRGPVKTCVEETNFPGATTSDGTKIPERKSWYTTEYDVDGRVMDIRTDNSDGSGWVMRYIYDASGHLLKTTTGKEGEPSQETDYSYDGQGRLLNITYSHAPDNPVTFRYDERGRKTKVQVSRPADYRPNTAVGGSPFEVADMAPNLPGGGSASTIYDEDDRPTEVQVRDAQGQLVSRAVRIYDAQGRIGEEKQILDSPERMFPAGAFDKILEASGASREELFGHITKLMGGQAGPYSIAYSYDAQGRVNQTRRQIFNQEHVIETTYNEHGDRAAEITQSRQIGTEKESTRRSGLAPYSEVHYSYRYDGYRNWTEQIVSYRSSPGGAFESSTGRRRTLTYY